MCRLHYDRWRRSPYFEKKVQQTCSVDGCELPTKGKGYCRRHYEQDYHGKNPHEDKNAGRTRLWHDPLERIMAKIKEHGSCWDWVGAKVKNGTGGIFILRGGQTKMVRRFLWEANNGPLGKTDTLTTSCGNAWCHNPEHLRIR